VLRVHVRPDAALTLSKSMKASDLHQNTTSGTLQRVIKNLYEDNYAAVKVIGDRGGTIQETIWNEWWQADPAVLGSIAGQVSEPQPQTLASQNQFAMSATPFVLAAPHMAPSLQAAQTGAQFTPTKGPWIKEAVLDPAFVWKHPMADVVVKPSFGDLIQDPRSWAVNPGSPQAGIGPQQSFMPMMTSAPQFGWSPGGRKRPGSDGGKEPGWDRVLQ